MKRIEFIAPVEAMRGNLSGAQNLKYPTQNNKAFESPEGSVNYARNYSIRFIGAKRASDGLKYFAVKTKTATHITARSLMAMALLGGAGAMYAALVRNKASQSYTGIYAQWLELQNYGSTKTFRSYVMDNFRRMLATKDVEVTFAGPRAAVTVVNPWTADEQTADMQVSQEILVKFWPQLSIDGYNFLVNGMKAIGVAKTSFADIVNNDYINKLDLAVVTIGGVNYVTQSDYHITLNGAYVKAEDVPVRDGKYTTTSIAPNAE